MIDHHIDTLFDKAKVLAKRAQLPGLAIVVQHKDKQHFCLYGKQSIDTNMPLNKHTVFPISSLTKAMTACLVGILVAKNKLTWDQPVQHILPDFNPQFTLVHLVTHTLGLPPYAMDYLGFLGFSSNDMLNALTHCSQTSAPTEFAYNNLGFVALEKIIEITLNASFEEALSTFIFKPLGMQHSSCGKQAYLQHNNRASPHKRAFNLQGNAPLALSRFPHQLLGAAGINCSIEDMGKWLTFWTHNQHQKLNMTAHEQAYLTQGVIPCTINAKTGHYAGGWLIENRSSHTITRHTGGFPGITSLLLTVKDKQLGIGILCNRSSIIPQKIADKFLQLFIDADYPNTQFAVLSPRALGHYCYSKIPALRKPKYTPTLIGRYHNPIVGDIAITPELTFGIGPMNYQIQLSPFNTNTFKGRFDNNDLQQSLGSMKIKILQEQAGKAVQLRLYSDKMECFMVPEGGRITFTRYEETKDNEYKNEYKKTA